MWRLTFFLPPDSLGFGTNPELLLEELAEIGPVAITALTDRIPELDALDPEVPYVGWQVDITADDPTAAVDDVFMFLKDNMEFNLVALDPSAALEPEPEPELAPVAASVAEPVAAPVAPMPAEPEPAAPVVVEPVAKARPAARAADKPEGADKAAATSLRVPAERLDELMDRVGELVIAQARLSQIAALSSDTALKTIAEELERLSSGLRDTTMGIRMVPIGTLFSRFRRLIHDLSSELGKPIEFITTGEETELDKTMIERLADPLVHLIRNSVDHGLENVEKRRAAGKPEKGVVRLSAVYSGAEVAISVTDDGQGSIPPASAPRPRKTGSSPPMPSSPIRSCITSSSRRASPRPRK